MDFVVLDTNVVVSALRSQRGASFAILRRIGEAWTPLISVPLILVYEAVGLREADLLNIPAQSVEAIVRDFCFFGREIPVYFRLRPSLPTLTMNSWSNSRLPAAPTRSLLTT